MTPIQEEVMRLVNHSHDAGPFPKKALPKGTSDAEIDAFSSRAGLIVPNELGDWLRLCNGPLVGRGGTYSMKDMEQEYQWFPEWKEKGWIKVADDGCGDPYVLDTFLKVGETHPVYFIDHETYEGQADYVVASGLWSFLRFLLMDDLESQKAVQQGLHYESLWPFNKRFVLAEDPALAQYKGSVPLAWDVD